MRRASCSKAVRRACATGCCLLAVSQRRRRVQKSIVDCTMRCDVLCRRPRHCGQSDTAIARAARDSQRLLDANLGCGLVRCVGFSVPITDGKRHPARPRPQSRLLPFGCASRLARPCAPTQRRFLSLCAHHPPHPPKSPGRLSFYFTHAALQFPYSPTALPPRARTSASDSDDMHST